MITPLTLLKLMPITNLLKLNQLPELILWLNLNGYKTREGKGEWQLIQIHVGTHWYVIYKTKLTETTGYVSIPETLFDIVKKFLIHNRHD